MEPVTTVTTILGLARAAGDIGKRLFELGKQVKDRELKHQLDEILDRLRELKQSASELEDKTANFAKRFGSKVTNMNSVILFITRRRNQNSLCA